jgi:hypothetical protein
MPSREAGVCSHARRGYALTRSGRTPTLTRSGAMPSREAGGHRLRRGMPPLAVTPKLAVRGQLGENPVQVIWLDAHRLGDFRNGYPGLVPHQLEGLIGSCVTPAAAPTRARSAARRCAACTGASGRASRTTWPPACALKRRSRSLQLCHFLLELTQTVIDVLHCGVDETRQNDSPRSVNGRRLPPHNTAGETRITPAESAVVLNRS